MSDIVFRRIGGRIVPIKRRRNGFDVTFGGETARFRKREVSKSDFAEAGVKSVIGFGAGYLGVSQAAKLLKRSTKAFNESALLRGASIGAAVGSPKRNDLIRKSAKKFIKGKGLSVKSRAVLALGGGVASVFIGSAAADITPIKGTEEEISGVAGALALGATSVVFGRKFGFKGTTDINKVFQKFSNSGRLKTSKLLKKFRTASYDPKRARKGTQFDLGL